MSNPLPRLLSVVAALWERRWPGGCHSDGQSPGTEAAGCPIGRVGEIRQVLFEESPAELSQRLLTRPGVVVADSSIEVLQRAPSKTPLFTADLQRLLAELTRLSADVAVADVVSDATAAHSVARAGECPFRRVEALRQAAPGLALRARVGTINGIGCRLATLAEVETTISHLAQAGTDIIRLSDPYNNVERLGRLAAASALRDTMVEGVLHVREAADVVHVQQQLDETISVATTFERQGVHALVLSDPAGLLRPLGAYTMVRALRRETRLPLWVNFCDGRGYGLAAAVAAVEAGAAGVDTVVPTLAGVGTPPDGIALSTALIDTERQAALSPAALEDFDTRVGALAKALDLAPPPPAPPVEAQDLGISADALWALEQRLEGVTHRDFLLSACGSARETLANPALTGPVAAALVQLAQAVLTEGVGAGAVMDRARTEQPGGFLDTVAAVRDGTLPDQEGEEQQATLAAVERSYWPLAEEGHTAPEELHGEVTLLPSAILARPLRLGDELSFLIEGEEHQVRVAELPGEGVGAVEYRGQRHDVPPTNRTKPLKTY
jgi:hypothetical protein